MVKHTRSSPTVVSTMITWLASAAWFAVIISLFIITRMWRTMMKKMELKTMTAIRQAMITLTIAVAGQRKPGSELSYVSIIFFTLVLCCSFDRISIQIIFVLEWVDYLQTKRWSRCNTKIMTNISSYACPWKKLVDIFFVDHPDDEPGKLKHEHMNKLQLERQKWLDQKKSRYG